MKDEIEDKTKDLIDTIWCDDYRIVAAGKSAPSMSDIKEVEQEFGVKFPKDFIVHSMNFFGGLYLEVKEEIWPRPSIGDVGPFWENLYGIITYSFNLEAPEWMQIDLAAEDFQSMGHTVVPILKVVGDADVYCVNQSGEIVRWRHEENSFEAITESFFDILGYELSELDERRNKKISKA